MTIAIYSRKSKITERGESIQNQIEMCKNYAITHFQVSESDILIYEDEGYSGGNTDRPELKRLLRDINRKKFDAIICYRLDRISRNVLDFSNILEALNKANTSFVSITEHFDTTTPMGRAMVNIAAVFAQLERETIAERIRDNMRKLARTGRYLGSTPAYGFKAEKIEYIDQNGNKKKMQKLAPVESDMAFVRTVYDKFLEFEGLSKVETWLMKNNYKNTRGNYIGTNEIRRMLSNPVYVQADKHVYDYYIGLGTEVINSREEFAGDHGMLIYGRHDRNNGSYDPKKWMVVIARHQGVIQPDKWLNVQMILEKNKYKAPRAGQSIHALLTSKIKCGNCNGTMVIIYVKKRDAHYYKCRNKIKSRKTICDIKNINGLEIDKEVYSYLKVLSENRDMVTTTLRKQRPVIDIDEKALYIEEQRIKKLIGEKGLEIKNLTIQLRDNNNSVASKYIIADIELLDGEIGDLNKSLAAICNEKEKINDWRLEEERTIDAIIDFGKNADSMSFERKRKAIDQIIDKIIWTGNDFSILFK